MVDLPRTSRLFGWAVDAAPGVVFLLVYAVTRDFRMATVFLIGAAAIALTASLAVERRLRPLPTLTGSLAVLFGGASLLLHSPEILKMKMTIVDGLLGAVLLIGVALKRNPLKMILGATFRLTDQAWATLAIRYGLFWWACAAANEVVRRTQSEHTWVLFRGAALAAGVVFAVAQAPFLLKHNAMGDAAEAPPPDLGV
ncbi:MAG TPA: septation protein IspZ [Caulobacteraceae bacterium]|jgi:intracellular septation protein